MKIYIVKACWGYEEEDDKNYIVGAFKEKAEAIKMIENSIAFVRLNYLLRNKNMKNPHDPKFKFDPYTRHEPSYEIEEVELI